MLKILKKAVKNNTLSRDREQKFRDYLTKQEFYRTVDDDQTPAYDDTLRYIYTKVRTSDTWLSNTASRIEDLLPWIL